MDTDRAKEDPTARMERIAKNVMDKLERVQEKILPSVVNRPLDARPMSRDQALADYRMTRDDTVGLNERLQEYVAQYGQVDGLEKWVSWVEDMEGNQGG